MDNITENNKLIAEFMDLELPLKISEYSTMISKTNGNYHKDWNWLMPVVEKIESLNYAVYLQTRSTRIESEDGKLMFWFFVGQSEDGKYEINSKIEAVYNTCVEFIKWYNKQNKNNESL